MRGKGKWWPWAWNRHDYIHPTSRQWLRRRATYLKRFLLDASKILWKSDDHSLAVILAEGWNYSCLQACTSFFPLKFFRAEKKKTKAGRGDLWCWVSWIVSVVYVDLAFPRGNYAMAAEWTLPPLKSLVPPLSLFSVSDEVCDWHTCWAWEMTQLCLFQALRRQGTDGVWRIHETALWIHQQPDEKSIQNNHPFAGWFTLQKQPHLFLWSSGKWQHGERMSTFAWWRSPVLIEGLGWSRGRRIVNARGSSGQEEAYLLFVSHEGGSASSK